MKWIACGIIGAIAALAMWYAGWKSAMRPHVARVEATIAHYNEQFKTSAYRATFKSAGVRASGFPFTHGVTIEQPNLAMVWGKETYAIEASSIALAFDDAPQGRYRVILPDELQALYSEEGKAPEAYKVDVNNSPKLWVRAKDTPISCKLKSCMAKPEDVLSEIGFQPNGDLLLTAMLDTKSEHIGFTMTALPVPVFVPIPNDPSRPVSLFVGMLREALVFNPKYQ